jgi:hypothetical protein
MFRYMIPVFVYPTARGAAVLCLSLRQPDLHRKYLYKTGHHQGAVAPWQLPYYLDEFTFRFNRRTSKSRGKPFFRLMQQAVDAPPATYEDVIKVSPPAPQAIAVC